MIADEPTSALDVTHARCSISLLMEECAARGATLVFVSHDASLESLFDRGLNLRDINQAGRIAHVDA
ncbi:MAG: hypothetical protein IPK65_06675 [Gammaproteobacteria bacterium]|nr:hypothetical protein [Gammaproteobacteria bacterium]